MKYYILLLTFITVYLLTGCKTPETVTKNFSKSIAKGDCEAAILLSTGKAQHKLINNVCNPFGNTIIDSVYCETGKVSATCSYVEKSTLYGLETESLTTLKLVKNKDWKVSEIKNNINKITGGNDAIEVTKLFIKVISEANIDLALILSIGSANEKIINNSKRYLKPKQNQIISIDVIEGVSKQNKICKTVEKIDGKIQKNIYHLTKINNEWRIDSFKKDYTGTPEGSTEKFVMALYNGDCITALELSTGKAYESVKATDDAGCESYESEIIGEIDCSISGLSAKCSCTEKRQLLGNLTFSYELIKVNGQWKISNFEKDNIENDNYQEIIDEIDK